MKSHFIVVLDFGYQDDLDEESSIDDLAYAARSNYLASSGNIVLAQSCTYEYLLQKGILFEEQVRKIDVGQSKTNGLRGGGSYQVLYRAAEMIAEIASGMEIGVILVAHELHMPRALKQARLVGLNAVPGIQLPSDLYASAAQWWCRSKYLWYLREAIGYLPLKAMRQL